MTNMYDGFVNVFPEELNYRTGGRQHYFLPLNNKSLVNTIFLH